MFLSKLECLVNEFDSLLELYYKIVEQEENDHSFVILSVGDKENTLCFQLVLNDIKEDYMEINFNSQERYLYEYIFLFYVVHFFNNMNLMVDEENHELSNKFFYSYFKVIVSDDILWDKIKEIINAKQSLDFEQIDELLYCQYKEMKFWQRRISHKLIVELNYNITKRKLLLRRSN